MRPLRLLSPVDARQRLRIRRFLMAFGTYLSSLALMGVYVWQGFMEPERYLVVAAAILATNAGLYAVLRSGLNLRLSDPSLTSAQIMLANVLLMLVLYMVDDGRGALLLLYMATFVFGIFRLVFWQFLVLEVLGVLGYAVVIALLLYFRPENVDLRLELVQLAALAFVLPTFAAIGGYISRLRQRLQDSKSELQRAFNRIRELAMYDEVTGLHNRRFLLEMLEHECARAERTGRPVTLALLDIDHFKAVNDRYGHGAGDRVLHGIAGVLNQALRKVDGLGRYGGEEFLAFMPGTAIADGRQVAERLRRDVEAAVFDDIAPNLQATVSIGLSELHGGERIEEAIDRADRALYAAKHRGRNQVAGG